MAYKDLAKKKAYHEKYRREHKDKMKAYQKEWHKTYYQLHREHLLAYTKQWRETNKEHLKEYYNNHNSTHKDYQKKWATENRKRCIDATTRWNKRNPDKCKEYWKRKQHRRERELGFNPLNSCFEGSEAHHVDSNNVIYIPSSLHKSYIHELKTPESMKVINNKAFMYLYNEMIS